jgi:hypothetical protein
VSVARTVARPIAALLAGALVAGCAAQPTATPLPTASPTPSVTSSPSATSSPSSAASPTATPAPPLSLDLPEGRDDRSVAVSVQVDVAPDGDGQITVQVTSRVEAMIDELVLRWPTDLDATLFLAPFTPSEERIRDGGPPLVQEWTKWVVGPGEKGEPAGTTSLGWGPLPGNATLTIPIVVNRVAPGPVAFDLQVLAGNDLLTLEDGAPAELRVEVP